MAQDNPILDMGLLNMWQPNKYIDPKFAGKPLQLPGFDTTSAGGSPGDMPPTDAMGKPIQSFVDTNKNAQADYQTKLAAYNANQPAQGTTLNSTPQGMFGNGQGQLSPLYSQQVQDTAMKMAQAVGGYPSGVDGGGRGTINDQGLLAKQAQLAPVVAQMMYPQGQQQQSTGQGQGQAPSPPNLRQAYLDALANPGKVTTPGATVPQSNPLGQPSVLNSFLANNPGGQVGNQGFFNTLNKLRSA